MRKVSQGGSTKKVRKRPQAKAPAKKTKKAKGEPAWHKAWRAGEVTPKTPVRLKRAHARKMGEILEIAKKQAERPPVTPKGPGKLGGGIYPLLKGDRRKLRAPTHPMWEEEQNPIALPRKERSRWYYPYNQDEFFSGRKLRKA